ncbi:MAG: hypothetical protein RBR68_13845 [Tenuifilaceae bacterium]|nr:hypothetical protein [Tenuifilaceae bacterium]
MADGIKLDSSDIIYNLGDTCTLMLQVADSVALNIGNTISVEIRDIFDNIISTISAELIGTNLYTCDYIIPLNLKDLYNTLTQDELEYDQSLFYLKDRWLFPNSEYLEYEFNVHRQPELATEDNSVLHIFLDKSIAAEDNTTLYENTEIKFTTKLNPIYCMPSDVISIYEDMFEDLDPIKTSLEIVDQSRQVDLYMKPDYIKYEGAFNEACKNYTALQLAYSKLNTVLNVQSEQKQLDTLQISRQFGDVEKLLSRIKEDMDFYANIIYAGGEDTPFKNKIFIKGIYDPNRTNISRAYIDNNSSLPYVNITTKSYPLEVNGNTLEIKGIRAIGFYNQKSAIINMVKGIDYD